MIDYNLSLTIQSILTITQIILDISIVWFVLYYAIRIIKNNSRTIQIFKGIVLIILIDSTAKFFGFQTVGQISSMFMNWGFLAVIIIFQPELRSLLERLGKSNVFSKISNLSGNEKEHLVDELVKATMILSEDQTGALISIEQSQSLQDYIKTGVELNSNVTAELLTSIFVTSTPLHDGACIIQGDKLACASAYFPPTNIEVANKYGARHRAAIGISEISDCVTIVVSEETGSVSIAERGSLKAVNKKTLREYLMRIICNEETEVRKSKIDTQKNIFVLDEPTVEIEIEKTEEVKSEKEKKEKVSLKDKLFIKKQKVVDGETKKSLFKRNKTEDTKQEETEVLAIEQKEDENSEIEHSDMKLPKKKKKVLKKEVTKEEETKEEVTKEEETTKETKPKKKASAKKEIVEETPVIIEEKVEEVVEEVIVEEDKSDEIKVEEKVVEENIEVVEKSEAVEKHSSIEPTMVFDDENEIASQFALIDSDEDVLEIRRGHEVNDQEVDEHNEEGDEKHGE